jgi:hypothetical protein
MYIKYDYCKTSKERLFSEHINWQNVLTVCCENKSKVGMEAFPDSERRQERRFNRKGVMMNIHYDWFNKVFLFYSSYSMCICNYRRDSKTAITWHCLTSCKIALPHLHNPEIINNMFEVRVWKSNIYITIPSVPLVNPCFDRTRLSFALRWSSKWRQNNNNNKDQQGIIWN